MSVFEKNPYPGELSINLNTKSRMSHLFRHASEITRETKGGYLEGRIELPKTLQLPVYGRLSLVPSEPKNFENPFLLHPNLLHINMKLNKKNRKLMEGELPEDVDWVVLLKIDSDGTVYRVCRSGDHSSEKRFQHNKVTNPQANSQAALNGEQKLKDMFSERLRCQTNHHTVNIGPLALPGNFALKVVTKLETSPDGVRYFELGNRGLMLNVITPLQKFSKGGATLSDVLKQRFQDVFQREISDDLLTKTEDIFTKKKEDRVKLQLVRLLLELFSFDSSLDFISSAVSDTITNSKSKECGPLQLHDVNPATSCVMGNTKVYLLSFFKLVSDVRPLFILWDPKEKEIAKDDLRKEINQPNPSESSVFNQYVLIFTTPPQDWEVIKKIHKKGLEIHITAYRPSDGRMSCTSFLFSYRKHNIIRQIENYDSDEDVGQEESDRHHGTYKDKPSHHIPPGQEDPGDSLNRETGNPDKNQCSLCLLLATKNSWEPKSLPLAKPGVHRRKTEIMTYDEKKESGEYSKYRPSKDALKIAEVHADGKVFELKVEPEELIDSQFDSKRQRLDADIEIKEEPPEDDDEVEEVARPQSRITDGHLTMPCPAPVEPAFTLPSVVTSNSGSLMPMVIKSHQGSTSNLSRTVMIISNHLQSPHNAIRVSTAATEGKLSFKPMIFKTSTGVVIPSGSAPRLMPATTGVVRLAGNQKIIFGQRNSSNGVPSAVSNSIQVSGINVTSGFKRPFNGTPVRLVSASGSAFSSTNSSKATMGTLPQSSEVKTYVGEHLPQQLLKSIRSVSQPRNSPGDFERLIHLPKKNSRPDVISIGGKNLSFNKQY